MNLSTFLKKLVLFLFLVLNANIIFSQNNISPIYIGDKSNCHEKILKTVLFDDSNNVYCISSISAYNGQYNLDFNGSSGPILVPYQGVFISKFNSKGKHILTKSLVSADASSTYSIGNFKYYNGSIEFILSPNGYVRVLGAALYSLIGGNRYKPGGTFMIKIDNSLNYKGYFDLTYLINENKSPNNFISACFTDSSVYVVDNIYGQINDSIAYAEFDRNYFIKKGIIIDTLKGLILPKSNIKKVVKFQSSKASLSMNDNGFQVRDSTNKVISYVFWEKNSVNQTQILFSSTFPIDTFIYIHSIQKPNSVILKIDKNSTIYKFGSIFPDTVLNYKENATQLITHKVNKNGNIFNSVSNFKIGNDEIINIKDTVFTILNENRTKIYRRTFSGILIDSMNFKGLVNASCLNVDNYTFYYGTYNDTIDIDFGNGVLLKHPIIKGCNSIFITSDVTNLTSNINNEKYNSKNIIYPNPTNSILNFEGLSLIENNFIEIYDVQGKLIMTKKIDEQMNVDISELDNGIYIIKIGEMAHRFIKM